MAGLVEVDDSFIGSPANGDDKRGRRTTKVLVISAASTNGESIGFVKMQVLDVVNKKEIKSILQTRISPGQTIKSDGWRAYQVAEELGHDHQVEIVAGRKAHKVLKWVHILASNTKASF